MHQVNLLFLHLADFLNNPKVIQHEQAALFTITITRQELYQDKQLSTHQHKQ